MKNFWLGLAIVLTAALILGGCGGSKTKAPAAEAPKAEAPKAEAPQAEAPKAEAPKAEAPKAEAPQPAPPVVEAPPPAAKAPEPVVTEPKEMDTQPVTETPQPVARAEPPPAVQAEPPPVAQAEPPPVAQAEPPPIEEAPKAVQEAPPAVAQEAAPVQPVPVVEAPAQPVAAALEFEAVYFDFDKYNIKPEFEAVIHRNAEQLRSRGATVIVEGHCDERGTTEYNLALGQRRAKAVRDALVQQGVDANHLDIVSYGEERPVAMGHDEASWSQNRRSVLTSK